MGGTPEGLIYDSEDQHIVDSHKWHINSTGYAVWRGIKDGKKQTIRLHRLITSAPDGLVVDHINHDKLDNRRSNLRVGTQSMNMRNKTDQGKGYWYQRQNKNWVVQIYGIHRGTFATEQEAASFAALVRAELIDKKPKLLKTHCSHGHSLHDAYLVKGRKVCKPCQTSRSKAYHERKKSWAVA